MSIDRTTLNFIYNYGKSELKKDITAFGKHCAQQYLSESKNGTILSEESDKIRNMRLAGLTPEELPPHLTPSPADPNNMSLSQQLVYRTYSGGSQSNQPSGTLVSYVRSKPDTSFSVVKSYQPADEEPIIIQKKQESSSLTPEEIEKQQIKMAASHLDKKPQSVSSQMAVSHKKTDSRQLDKSTPTESSVQNDLSSTSHVDDPWYQDTLNWMNDNKLATAGIVGVPLALAGSYLAYKKLKSKK